MHSVKRGIMEKKPIALFTALLVTTWGHSLPEVSQLLELLGCISCVYIL